MKIPAHALIPLPAHAPLLPTRLFCCDVPPQQTSPQRSRVFLSRHLQALRFSLSSHHFRPQKSSFPPLETIIFTSRNDCLGIKNAVENLKTPLGAIASCVSLTPFRTGTHGAKGRFGWFYKLVFNVRQCLCFTWMSSRLSHRIFLSFIQSRSTLRSLAKNKNLRHDSRKYIAS